MHSWARTASGEMSDVGERRVVPDHKNRGEQVRRPLESTMYILMQMGAIVVVLALSHTPVTASAVWEVVREKDSMSDAVSVFARVHALVQGQSELRVFRADNDSLYCRFALGISSPGMLGDRPPVYRIDGNAAHDLALMKLLQKSNESFLEASVVEMDSELVAQASVLAYDSGAKYVVWRLAPYTLDEIMTGGRLLVRYYLPGDEMYAEVTFSLSGSGKAIREACGDPPYPPVTSADRIASYSHAIRVSSEKLVTMAQELVALAARSVSSTTDMQFVSEMFGRKLELLSLERHLQILSARLARLPPPDSTYGAAQEYLSIAHDHLAKGMSHYDEGLGLAGSGNVPGFAAEGELAANETVLMRQAWEEASRRFRALGIVILLPGAQ